MSALAMNLAYADPSVVTPVDPPENKVAPESEKSLKPSPPLVQEVSPGVFKIGKLTIKKDSREISFSAETKITGPDEILEFLLVHRNGEKIHETLLVTDADPEHIQIALKLLRFKESNELFRVIKPDGTRKKEFYSVPEDIRKAARFDIHLMTDQDGEKKSFPANDWVTHRVLKKPMPLQPWVFNGSYIHENKFNAKLTGSIFAIFSNMGAIANYSGEGREDDSLWLPSKRVLATGSKVTVILKPWK
ncbi:MAG: YdjY domain-containing protein [Akkermansiaceae bacterium]